ncbi:putative phospholipid-transporting ATPase IIB [Ceratocystis fimbriata CBS 114723]|uniref:Phospholipid-transporting ATPase n=1 Tax=Ceratocystis fimbriata CBS 114723 TaxID=1035309 RepID=A0A2C5X1K8_9PEZI|nr:putative phospholipid-transporting ATPase IIB [Ceratocystis fimbriata CBS 114723]
MSRPLEPPRPTEPPDISSLHDSDSHSNSESDLELELEELVPRSPSKSASKSFFSDSRNTPGNPSSTDSASRSGPRIALRKLRMGGRRTRRYGDLGQNRDDHDDTENLIGGSSGGGHHSRQNSGLTDDDDTPLLSSGGGFGGAGGGLDPGNGGSWAQKRHRQQTMAQKIKTHIQSVMPWGSGSDSLRSPRVSSPAGNASDDEDDNSQDAGSARIVAVGSIQSTHFPANGVSNAKYTALTFLPITLYNEFSFFFNMYFLLVALSQAIPALRIGYLLTYIAPLIFVLCITMGKEAWDDIERRRRDNEANSEGYTVLSFDEPTARQEARNKRQDHRTLRSEALPGRSKRRANNVDRLSDVQEEEDALENDGGILSSTVRDVWKKSKDLKVGDVLKLGKGQRVPADVVILKCYMDVKEGRPSAIEGRSSVDSIGNTKKDDSGSSGGTGGETFIRTDQLDGETDWKLRLASPLTQSLPVEEFVRLRVTGGKPDRKVGEFAGTLELLESRTAAQNTAATGMGPAALANSTGLSIDNTAWANTVIASQGVTLGVIMYTGPQTRSAMSTAPSRSKIGLLEYEINSLTKILCGLTLLLSIVLVALEGFENTDGAIWYVKIMRFLVLFSTIVPISLRVNLDMGKSAYSYFIQHDPGIPGALVRTSTIPEDLGRIEYLLSDKTGTLTQNEMEMKKIHIGTVSYANEAMDEVSDYVRQGLSHVQADGSLVTPSTSGTTVTSGSGMGGGGGGRTRREIGSRVRDVVLALALCHNVTPTVEDDVNGDQVVAYQASSPDEIAIVKWTEAVGLRLAYRDRTSMVLESTHSNKTVVQIRILDIFPFTSEGKRMGIVVQFLESQAQAASPLDIDSGEIWFYQKGADTVMGNIVAANDWLDEETVNMAREGLRTLVVGRRRLSAQQYREFSTQYQQASLSLVGRDAGMASVVSLHLERDLELLGVTGVEDKLQRDVKPSLELLRNAGIKIWMLTGDKVETARCVAVSSKLVARGQYIYTVQNMRSKDNAQQHLDFLRSKPDSCLLVDGDSLALFLSHFRQEFVSVAVKLPTVVACRCSPGQKAEVARLIREYTKKRVCCIGDGGNDVSMIQAADVGVGIVGKEGRQASLAADFSIEQFFHLTKLLVWHGRNSYKRSAKLAQFVVHRGLIIAVCQTVYSIAIKFEPEGLYKDWLMVGYSTIYTAFPVLSLVLDKDVDENLATLYPELYKELTSGKSLSYRTFFVWVFVSIYQGTIIQGFAQILTEVDGSRMLAVSYTVLVLNELLMVAIEITTWHWLMVLSIVGTFLSYLISVPFLGNYFDLSFVASVGFLWRCLAIAAISLVPPYAGKVIRRTMNPPSYRKVQST